MFSEVGYKIFLQAYNSNLLHSIQRYATALSQLINYI